MHYRSNTTYFDGRKFDSEFESCVFLHLLDSFPVNEYEIKQQYKLPLLPRNSHIKPNRSSAWRCDFAVFRKGEDQALLFVEAKGQVDRVFPLTLALLEDWIVERLVIICSDEKAVTKLKKVSKKRPFVEELCGIPDLHEYMKYILQEAYNNDTVR